MEYKILTVNDRTEEKFLRKKAANFDFSTRLIAGQEFSRKEIDNLIKEMRKIMKDNNGIGLSANQIGLDLQFFVAEIPQPTSGRSKKPKLFAIFNPKIAKFSKELSILNEGCLSVPKIYGDVERPERVTLTGWDKNGKEIKIKAFGLLSKVFQHEVDHLNGILFIDKAKNLAKYEVQESPEKSI